MVQPGYDYGVTSYRREQNDDLEHGHPREYSLNMKRFRSLSRSQAREPAAW